MENYLKNKREVLNGRLIWNSVCSHIAQKFTNLKLYTKENPSIEDYGNRIPDQKLTNIVRGRNLFKGNTLNIWSTKKAIGVSNSYYCNHVIQEHNIETGISTIKYSTHSKRGKWTGQLITAFNSKKKKSNPVLNSMQINIPKELFKEHNNSETEITKAILYMHEWGDVQMHLDVKYKQKGNLNFQNNWENINDIKRLSKIKSYILKTIKENPLLILNQTLAFNEDLYYYNLTITKNNLITKL
jgi:hypothetical protein